MLPAIQLLSDKHVNAQKDPKPSANGCSKITTLRRKALANLFFFASKKKGTEKERNMHYIQISKHINFSIGVLVIAP